MDDKAYNIVLEAVWGLHFKPLVDALVYIPRPWGFVVAERRVRARRPGGWDLYFLRKEGLSTTSAARALAGAVGALEFRVYGLKDTHAVAYQYVALKGAARREPYLRGDGWEAWLVAEGVAPPRLGGHLWNNFRLELAVLEGSAGEVCGGFEKLGWVPGFYGPQRFGVDRPDTHLQGLYRALGGFGWLVREFSYSYGSRGGPGGYEARALRDPGYPFSAPRYTPGIVVEAFQSYVWNRALSKALEGDPSVYAEREARALCPSGGRALVARLPSRSLLRSSTRWAGLVREVLREEGVPPWVLPGRAPMRPLLVEPCRVSCRASEGGVTVWLTLPRGIYATVAVRSVAFVAWDMGVG